jgi:hypothetical protein
MLLNKINNLSVHSMENEMSREPILPNHLRLDSGGLAMAMVDQADGLSRCFAVFRPSERIFLKTYFEDRSKIEIFEQALGLYLKRINSDDLADKYRLRIVGRWIGENANHKAKLALINSAYLKSIAGYDTIMESTGIISPSRAGTQTHW